MSASSWEEPFVLKQGNLTNMEPDIRVISSVEDGERIFEIFQTSYAREAALIGVAQHMFPPLLRTTKDIRESPNLFLGAFLQGVLCGVLELERTREPHEVIIASLTVHPDAFRKGIGRALVTHIVHTYHTVRVSTDAKNQPAMRLYRSCGFEEVSRTRLDDTFLIVSFVVTPTP